MLEKCTAEGINIRKGIFNLSKSTQNTWNGFEAEIGKITDVIVFNVSLSERFQMHESRISIS